MFSIKDFMFCVVVVVVVVSMTAVLASCSFWSFFYVCVWKTENVGQSSASFDCSFLSPPVRF